jgi:hypothetical protein
MSAIRLAAAVLAIACAAPARAAPPSVEMTWMSIANGYFKIGDKRIVMDGYISEGFAPPSPWATMFATLGAMTGETR